jgi:PAS domain S-box-containing protein
VPDAPRPSNESLVVLDHAFRILVEGVEDYAIYLLDPDGYVRSCNAGARLIKGYAVDEIVGKHFSTFYPPDVVASGQCARLLEKAHAERVAEDTGWRVRKDGSQFWASVTITRLDDRDGNHLGFAKIMRDLTERSYRSFVEAAHAIVWTTDGTGRPSADSPSWRAFTGQTVEEWFGRRAYDPVHPEDQPCLREQWPEARAEKRPFEAEFRLRRSDGEYVWMATRAIPFFDERGEVREWFGVTFDISARKRAETELSLSLERERAARDEAERGRKLWTTTLSSIGDAVIATDVEARITFMNPIAEELTGWTLADARGRPLGEVFSIVNEETRRKVESPVARVLREGAIVGLANHTVLVRRDGTDLPIDDSAAPIRDDDGKLFGVVMVFRDVSRDKREAARRSFLMRAGDALLNANDYRSALRAVAELAVPQLADWCAVDVLEPDAKAATQLAVAHVDPAKVQLAKELGRKYPPDPNAPTGSPNVIRTGQPELYRHIPQAILEASAKDDAHREIIRKLSLRSAMIVPLRGRDRVFGAITFVHAESAREYTDDDLVFAEELARRGATVIERRRLEEERATLLAREREARAQADLANRAKDEFLATVSHELRNPLNAILGWSALLQKRELPADVLRALGTIERNARAQARLIEDVLDMARVISGKLRLDLGAADVAQAIADAVESIRPTADSKSVRVTTRLGPGLRIRADQVRVQQIVSNLLSNAVKFTDPGGSVELSAAIEGPTLRIAVRDSGDGIDPALLGVIFEPFRQVDGSTTRRHGGLGLGLAIVRQLTLAHGGSVRAESEGRGQGATFVVELPAPPPGARGRRSTPPDPGASRRDKRVVVVDDDADAVGLIAELLEQAGARVATATSASTAFAEIRRAPPDVLVSDIGMPDEDGFSLVRRVRALAPGEGGATPAVALTAYSRPEDAERAHEAGFQRHVAKPVDPDEFLAIVAELARSSSA